MFAKTTPESPLGFINVKNDRALVTGYVVHKITGLAGEMATDRKRVVRASYLGSQYFRYPGAGYAVMRWDKAPYINPIR